MFSETKKGKDNTEASAQPNRISKKTKIKGDINSESDFRIDGALEGTVITPGKVVIGKQGSIDGKVSCGCADIEGSFTGQLEVTNTLSLKASAVVKGETWVGKLAVEPGATFNASCTMGKNIPLNKVSHELQPNKMNGSAKVS